MAQDLEGPVRITIPGGGRETGLEADAVHIGRSTGPTKATGKKKKTPVLGILRGPLLPGQQIDDDGVFVDADNVPKVPAVALHVGDRQAAGGIWVRDDQDRPTITLNGITGTGTFGTDDGQAGSVVLRSGANGRVIVISGKTGGITFFDDNLHTTLTLDGVKGDIELHGADCAEDFDVVEAVPGGSVMCVDDDGRLRACTDPYDRRVAGVVSGAGGWKPALRLDRSPTGAVRAPVALVGKVFCLADADRHPIGVGDLLTTSATPGHAMRAADPARAFGAVLGKSLGRLAGGQGLVPVLVALQ